MFSIDNLCQRSADLDEEIQSLKDYLDKTDFSEHLVARTNLYGSFSIRKQHQPLSFAYIRSFWGYQLGHFARHHPW